MDERLKFIARLLDGERMTDLCREFGISRKTGYKVWSRYQNVGVRALSDRSRRPYRYANQIPMPIEKFILRCKQERPTWGAPKIRELVLKKFPEIKPPAKSTVHAVLHRHGLVDRKRSRKYKAKGTALAPSHHPNDLWCTDFKGEFMLGDKRYCYSRLSLAAYPSAGINPSEPPTAPNFGLCHQARQPTTFAVMAVVNR